MVDLETMGNTKEAAITAIGACAYDSKSGNMIEEAFYKVVKLENSVKEGLKMDASTVIWWMNQSEEAK
jgi:hypothetical protein